MFEGEACDSRLTTHRGCAKCHVVPTAARTHTAHTQAAPASLRRPVSLLLGFFFFLLLHLQAAALQQQRVQSSPTATPDADSALNYALITPKLR